MAVVLQWWWWVSRSSYANIMFWAWWSFGLVVRRYAWESRKGVTSWWDFFVVFVGFCISELVFVWFRLE